MPARRRDPAGRLLLSAYACAPGRGSEPGIGWNVASELAVEFDVTVVTRENNREAIEAVPAPPGVHFVYHDLPASRRWWKRGPLTTQLYYELWQRSLAGPLRELTRPRAFDVAMHVTFGRYWVPTPLVDLPTPFVFGPVGGADSVPAALKPALGVRGRAFNRLRETVRDRAERRPDVRRTLAEAAVVLATTPASARRIEALGAPRVRVEPAVGLRDAELDELADAGRASRAGEATTFVSVGRLLAWKGFALGIRAFASLASSRPGARYRIVGDGSDRPRLERLARRLGVADRVEFLGDRSRPETLETMARADALVHPSFHDTGGWVCLEAMALGRPVICLSLAGPRVLVPGDAGILVAPSTPDATAASLADAMARIAADREAAERMGAAGRTHVRAHYAWSERGRVLRDICRTAAES